MNLAEEVEKILEKPEDPQAVFGNINAWKRLKRIQILKAVREYVEETIIEEDGEYEPYNELRRVQRNRLNQLERDEG